VVATFSRAWKTARWFNPRRQSFRGWALGILREEAHKASLRALRTPMQQPAGERPIEGNPLADAMAGLPEEQRAVLAMRYAGKCTYDELGQALGVRERAARSRVRQALAALRMELRDASS
jgi:RNA polymerase sigma factor (sigma-70 family)